MIKYFIKAKKDMIYHLDVLTGWSYSEHLTHSLHIGFRLIKIAIIGFVHGLFPWILPSYAPKEIIKLSNEMKRLRHSKVFDE